MTRLCDHVSHMTSVVEMELVRSAVFVCICCASVLVAMVILHAPVTTGLQHMSYEHAVYTCRLFCQHDCYQCV